MDVELLIFHYFDVSVKDLLKFFHHLLLCDWNLLVY